MHPFKKEGFSLVEALVAITLFALINLAVYSNFHSATNLLRRIRQTERVEDQRFLLKIEKIGQELRQIPKFEEIGFFGSQNKIVFTQIINSEICRMTYFFDSTESRLLRGFDRFVDILSTKDREVQTKLSPYINKIEDVKFSFFYFDNQKNAYLWKDKWEEKIAPLALKIELSVNGQNKTHIFFIPTS